MRLTLTNMPVYYINLDEDVDKATQLETWLTGKGFTNIIRWPGVKHPGKGIGCALAHNSLLRHLATVDTPFIVLEDDVKPWRWANQIEIPDDADAYYLGLSKYGLVGNVGKLQVSAVKTGKAWRLYNMLAAHGILYINSDYVRWIVRATQAMIDLGTNQDKARAQTLKYWNIYGPDKALIFQDGRHRLNTKVVMGELSLKNPKDLL